MYPRTITLNGQETLVSDEQQVGVFEHLSKNYRIVNIFGPIVQEVGSVSSLYTLDSLSKEPIKLIINSPGGLLDATFLLYDSFKLVSSPIYTIGTYCCSAATLLLAAGTKRYVTPHCRVMLHLLSGKVEGDVRDWEIQFREMEIYKDKMIELLQECGVQRSKEEILKDIDREHWMGAEEAIKYGLADEILTQDIMQEWLS